MAFKRRQIKRSIHIQNLTQRGRDGRTPDDIVLPVKSTDKSKPVSKFHNSFALSNRYKFTLRAYGKPFNYHGVLTKCYDIPAMEKLFLVDIKSIYNWVSRGYLPEPYVRVLQSRGRRYWFYHQVQPFYTWYWNRRARGLRISHVSARDHGVLKRLVTIQERQWCIRLGVEFGDPYSRIAGRYGVIYPVEN